MKQWKDYRREEDTLGSNMTCNQKASARDNMTRKKRPKKEQGGNVMARADLKSNGNRKVNINQQRKDGPKEMPVIPIRKKDY